MADTKVRVQDDLFEYVNGDWEKQAKIPDDESSTGGFNDLAREVEKKMMGEFAAMADGKEEIPDKYFAQAITLYKQALDFDTRDAAGIKPILPRLAKIQSYQTLADYTADFSALQKGLYPAPFSSGVSPDMKDTSKNAYSVAGIGTILPDTTYYQEGNKQAATLLAAWEKMARGIIAQTPLSADEQDQYIKDTLAFDKEVAKHIKSREEWADYPAAYNPTPTAEVAKQLAPFDFEGLLKDILPAVPDKVIVEEPRFFKEFNQLFNEANYPLFIHWAYVQELLGSTAYLSNQLRIDGGAFGRAMTGRPQAASPEKHAYRVANSRFSEPVGIYYGRKYFGEKAKADVTEMVEDMIETYKERLGSNDWLSQSTKDKAIVKLNKMVLKMGYPDHPKAVYDRFHVDAKKSLFENIMALNEAGDEYNREQLTQPVDRTEWNMPGHLVNASYDPNRNDITFPAAILQAPFYSLQQSRSENLGGIGAVIAHEISHGFDNNGAKFDEFGNMKNWWQEADFKKFKELTQGMIDEFDGLKVAGGTVNGKQIVSENIADDGGLSAALATAKKDPNVDLEAFFLNWGRIWREKARKEYAQFILAIDVHAPNKLRANIQVQNQADWYTTFNVQPGDGMYKEPAKRVVIW
ncbi:M13 family metallopeptidase [Schleiferilactobacillus perolens]|jgi:putative endopeptidase|uniref:M13 family metallopeptidase n=1 Tax=Schleiferilactobacillus perolens TaxID=100468 RepID=UPI0023540D9C|nr:M13-type metalloendopeptidase [Schleiferilactobacillus perolens]MCI2172580.1 M13 family peptidase [Schleiferilactobacillus perolens]